MQHKALSRTRRASVLGFTAGVLVLSMTSSAFACTYFYGKLTVTAADPLMNLAPTSAYADGSGNELDGGSVHGYCPLPAEADSPGGYSGVGKATWPAQPMFDNAKFTVQAGPTTTCLKQNSLATAPNGGGLYDVRWLVLSPEAVFPETCFNDQSGFTPLTAADGLGNQVNISASTGTSAKRVFFQGPGSAVAGTKVAICLKKPGTGAADPGPPEVKVYLV